MASALQFDVRNDLRAAVARLRVDSSQLVERATVTALNRTMNTVRTEAVRRIRARYNVKAAAARKQMRIRRANRRDLYAELVVTGRNIPLYEFAARQTSKGVTVRVTKQRKLVRNTFIARMKSGHIGVFERLGKPRLPIRELFSIALPKAFTQKQIITALQAKAAQRFPIEFERAARFGGRG